MPLNANFLADFSSFLDATKSSIAATKEFETAAAGLGPTLDRSLETAGSSIDEQAAKMHKLGEGIGIALASQELRNLAGDVKNFATTYINEFAEAEAATSRMTAALVASGETSPEVAKAYGEMATELQRMSTFSDEAITDAQTLLTTIGGIKPDAMKETLQATMDLAKGMGVDLATAVGIVGKAASSDGEALGRLKTILGDSVQPGADFAEVMQAINEKFGGQSAAAMDTTAGKLENLNNQMSDINEMVGSVLAENLTTVLGLFQSLPEGVQTFVLAVVGIGTALAPVLVSLTSLVSLLSTAGFGAAIVAGFKAILPFLGPAGWIAAGVIAVIAVWRNWDTITEIAKRVYEGVKTWMMDKLTAIVNYIVTLPGRVSAAFQAMYNSVVGHSSVPDMVDGISSQFGRLNGEMVNPAMSAIREVMGGFSSMANALQELGPGALGFWKPGIVSYPKTYGQAPTQLTEGGWVGPKLVPDNINVTINMSGMMSSDDPQTRAALKDLISDALMEAMRGTRLMGTA